MQLSLLLLLVLSLLIIVLSVVTARSLRNSAPRDKAPTRARRESPRAREVPAASDRSAIWTSPIWNVAGVVAGIVGAIVSAIGLIK